MHQALLQVHYTLNQKYQTLNIFLIIKKSQLLYQISKYLKYKLFNITYKFKSINQKNLNLKSNTKNLTIKDITYQNLLLLNHKHCLKHGYQINIYSFKFFNFIKFQFINLILAFILLINYNFHKTYLYTFLKLIYQIKSRCKLHNKYTWQTFYKVYIYIDFFCYVQTYE